MENNEQPQYNRLDPEVKDRLIKMSDAQTEELQRSKITTDFFLKNALSKREQFAMAAMQGICANPTSDIPAQAEPIARIAIEIADELLKQLESK